MLNKFKNNILFLISLIIIANLTVISQEQIKFEKPVLITSAGQSADVTLVSMICKKNQIEVKSIAMATPSDLSGIKTLIIVAGFSSKGLGAAGVSREQEMSRVKDVIKAAKDKKIKILMMHIGGKSRRGNQSDDFNKLSAEAADYMIVVKKGDEDQFFSNISKSKNIPLKLVDKIAGTGVSLSSVF